MNAFVRGTLAAWLVSSAIVSSPLLASSLLARVPTAQIPAAQIPAAQIPAAEIPAAEIPAAQIPTALLREGDLVPSVGPNAVVSSISNTAVNGVFGFAVTLRTDDGAVVRSHVWGSATGLNPGVLLTNQLVGTLDQGTFEEFFGLDDSGTPSYSAICVDLSTGAIDIDTTWIGPLAQAVEDQPIPSLPGKVWRFASRPGVTGSGKAYWLAGINDQATGALEGNGLFFAGTPLLKTGDLVPGLPAALDTNAIDVDYRFSAEGNHWITLVDVATGSAVDDGHVLLDGVPVVTAAGTVAENQPIPPTSGGMAGERWDNFDSFSISESGEFLFTGDTDGAFESDEFVARNGVIIYREGDTVDGEILTGAIETASMNERGDIAYVWDVAGAPGTGEALFLNGRILLRQGDPIDLDGDGLVDPNAVLVNLTGTASLSIGEDKTVYVTAEIDTAGTPTAADDIEVVLAVRDPCGSVRRYGAGCVGTGGFTPSLALEGCVEPGASVAVVVEGGLGGAAAVLLFGSARGDALLSPSSPSCSLLVTGLLPLVVVLPLGGLPGVAGEGSLVAMSAIPAGMPQIRFTAQALIVDPANPFSGAVTNGLEIEIGF